MGSEVELPLKWPSRLTLIRHGESRYNVLRAIKEASPVYQEFRAAFDEDPTASRTIELAHLARAELALPFADHNTPLTEEAARQAQTMAANLRERENGQVPDIIYVSPYLRTHDTLRWMTVGWPELGAVPKREDDRLREQNHGISTIYNDWRIFHTLQPDQRAFYEQFGELADYWYPFPQGESVPQVRERLRSWQNTLVREHAGENVMGVSHHLTILSQMANLEHYDATTFVHIDKKHKPINCGVTIYQGVPGGGQSGQGKLQLEVYNARLY